MATAAWKPLATITLGSTAAGVTFSSIPNTYRDLVVLVAGTAVSATQVNIRFNGDTGSNHLYMSIDGSGSGTGSFTWNANTGIASSANLSSFTTSPSMAKFEILDYAQTNKTKTVLFRSGTAGTGTGMGAGRWNNTAAITTVYVFPNVNFAAGTTISLYGVKG